MQNKVVGVFRHNFRDSFEMIHSLSFYIIFTFHDIHSLSFYVLFQFSRHATHDSNSTSLYCIWCWGKIRSWLILQEKWKLYRFGLVNSFLPYFFFLHAQSRSLLWFVFFIHLEYVYSFELNTKRDSWLEIELHKLICWL